MDAIKYFKEKKRMTNGCKSSSCKTCPLSVKDNNVDQFCTDLELEYPEKAVEIVEKWAEGHPVKTRQSELLKLFPNALVGEDGVLTVCPCSVEKSFEAQCNTRHCNECCKDYWLVEIRNEEVGRE